MDAEICLTCLGKSDTSHDLNEILLENLKILEILNHIVSLDMDQKVYTLPNRICDKCLEKLTIAYSFQRQCLDSMENLHKLWLKNLPTKDNEQWLPASNLETKDNELTIKSLSKTKEIALDSLSVNVKDHEISSSLEQDNKIQENEVRGEKPLKDSHRFEEEVIAANQCKLCNKLFKGQQGLASHMSKTHFKKHLYQCKICERGFSVEELFIRHCNQHLGIKPFPCSQCDKAFDTRTILKKHLLSHCKRPTCGKKLSHIDVLEQQPGGEEEKLFQCSTCTENFDYYSAYEKHIKTHETKMCTDDDDDEELVNMENQPFQTDEHNDDKEEEKPIALAKIKNEYKEELETPVEVIITDIKIENVVGKHESGTDESKSSLDNIKEKNQHTKCDLCNQQFKNAHGLARHRSSTHFKKHLYQCDKCDRGFSVEEHYIKHRNRHLGIKAFKCNQCDKAFETNSILNQHLISHSKLTPYLCTICGKSFRRIDSLRQHIKRHGDERPFKCSDCPKSFKCLSDKIRHMRMHDEKRRERYVCNICGSRLATSESLLTHQRTHTGEKPFKCRHCDKGFICSINMTRHERIHTGEKPYSCQYCSKTFCQSSDRNKHTKRMHKNEISNMNSDQNKINLQQYE